MDKKGCKLFFSLRNSISDKLDKSGNYQFINPNNFNEYCTNDKCSDNLGKVNAGCLFLLDAFFIDSTVFNSVAKSNINIIDYIIIWLSYMLNLKKSEGNISNLKYFYNTYINNDQYKKSINGVTEYKDYKDLIDKANMVNLDMRIISKFYHAFNELCMMYIEFDEQSPNCNKCSKYADEFVKKYKILNNDSDITKDGPYYKLLTRLSNDYENFKNKCNDFPSLSTIETAEKYTHSSEDASSNSSIVNKLFIVLSIFGAIAFFLGISYKYSLFGFRKRVQKQYIREKIKNIKKKMVR
ncbi:PIR protein [Plasmodium yoelii]|uniref:PIR protein n=2 Tax=Plasmodium yoelii TaxID=5861 RepID=A0AAE9X2S0_PLAYO|nr:PIR protein [Plasmodium yoelii]WBY60557.1 PIR protein [Plasmodium yoelii yoelii]CDU20373.1 YIR protein [Plasmodium yoelii]VTZ81333.1 PIR protein [Plasmodium yoelii]|eukprot:XP_022812788.1 PIR protein [Plasmodium yoelii]